MLEAGEYQWKNIGDRIREARKKVGLTQAQLAKQVGVSSQIVWCWEAGRVKPTHDHLEELAFRCEVSTAWLLGRDVVEAELLKEASVSFHDAVEGLPLEDIETIQNFINFIRQERRRKTEAGEGHGPSGRAWPCGARWDSPAGWTQRPWPTRTGIRWYGCRW